jgi:hypothetical protein
MQRAQEPRQRGTFFGARVQPFGPIRERRRAFFRLRSFISALSIPRPPPLAQPCSFPRRVFAPGVVSFLVSAPRSEGSGAPRDEGVLARHPRPAASRPGACEAPASLAIGTLASRRSTLAIFGVGPAFPAPPFPAEHVQPAPGSTGRSARRAVSEPPESVVRATAAGRQASLHLQDRLRTAPFTSEVGAICSINFI